MKDESGTISTIHESKQTAHKKPKSGVIGSTRSEKSFFIILLIICLFPTFMLAGQFLFSEADAVNELILFCRNNPELENIVDYAMKNADAPELFQFAGLRLNLFANFEAFNSNYWLLLAYPIYALLALGVWWYKSESGRRKDFADMLPIKRKAKIIRDYVKGLCLSVIPLIIWMITLSVGYLSAGAKIKKAGFFHYGSLDEYLSANVFEHFKGEFIIDCILLSFLFLALIILMKYLCNSFIMTYVSLTLIVGTGFLMFNSLIQNTLFFRIGSVFSIIWVRWGAELILSIVCLFVAGKMACTEKGYDYGAFRYRPMEYIFLAALFLLCFIIIKSTRFIRMEAILTLLSLLIAAVMTVATGFVIRPRNDDMISGRD